ncbi:hypothetical protein ACKVWC_008502 [Pyricularia oryzae]
MPSRRVFGGHLTESQDGQAPGSAGLSGDAPEFVPGHAPPQGRSQPKQPPPPAVLPAKSSAPDLPTRIHEDINNRQYDCVICMNEILRSSRLAGSFLRADMFEAKADMSTPVWFAVSRWTMSTMWAHGTIKAMLLRQA